MKMVHSIQTEEGFGTRTLVLAAVVAIVMGLMMSGCEASAGLLEIAFGGGI